VVDLDPVAAEVLGRIAGHVGGAQQRRGALGLGVISTTPMLAPTEDVALPDEAEWSRTAWRTLSAISCACSSVQCSEQHAELVAAQRATRVGADARLQQRGDSRIRRRRPDGRRCR
jgi:hypothetical protein